MEPKSPRKSPPDLSPAPRLPWQPYAFVHGFIAYPDGAERPHRYAAIWPDSGARHGAWRWLARIDPPDKQPGDFAAGVFRNGMAADKQMAADAATAAWPEVTAAASTMQDLHSAPAPEREKAPPDGEAAE